MCFFERKPSGEHFNWWQIEDLTWAPSTIPASLFHVIFVKTVAMNDDMYLFYFQSEGWLHSACTQADKRSWTASKALSVRLSKSHWQTWSPVCTDGTWKWDLFAHGGKGSLIWRDCCREQLACMAVTTSSHVSKGACTKYALNMYFFFYFSPHPRQAMFLSWRCAGFMHRGLSGAPAAFAALCLCSSWATHCMGTSHEGWTGRKAAVTVYLCSCSGGPAGKPIERNRGHFSM